MRTRIVIASLLFILGVAPIIDWFVFCSRNDLKKLEWERFKAAYVAHFPGWLQPLFSSNLATWLSMALLVAAGWLYLGSGQKIFKVMAVISFLLAFWNLFSLM